MKNKRKIIILTILIILSLFAPFFNPTTSLANNETTNSSQTQKENEALDSNNSGKKLYDSNDSLPDIPVYSKSAILVDSKTGKILYNKNAKEKKYPASTTKILTAILVLDNCNLDDKVVVDEESISLVPAGYTVAPLQVGEELTVKQLLQLLLIPSANDVANVLAKHVGGSIEGFADMMNAKAKELGCLNSHFVNPNGKHDENHYSTAYDLAIIMDYCIKNDTFREITTSSSCIIPETNKYMERVFSSTNEMLMPDTRDISSNYYYQYLIAGKTGYTSEANNCFVGAAEKDGLTLISVVLDGVRTDEGLSARFADTKTLFEYGYSTYTIRKLRETGSIAKDIEISNATRETKNLDLLISDDIVVLVKQKDIDKTFEPEITLRENLEAPITKGELLGTITYEIEGIKYTSNVIASHSVEKDISMIFILIVIGIIVALFALYKSNQSKTKRKKRHYNLNHKQRD